MNPCTQRARGGHLDGFPVGSVSSVKTENDGRVAKSNAIITGDEVRHSNAYEDTLVESQAQTSATIGAHTKLNASRR